MNPYQPPDAVTFVSNDRDANQLGSFASELKLLAVQIAIGAFILALVFGPMVFLW